MGISKGVDRVPFWTEVIERVRGSSQVPASSVYSLTVQPPQNETWCIFFTGTYFRHGAGNWIELAGATDGTDSHLQIETLGSYGLEYPFVTTSWIVSHDKYLVVRCRNTDSANAYSMIYGYSGFKLGTKKAEFIDEEKHKTKIFERTTKYKIKSEFNGLEDMVFDVYDEILDDYKQVIYLYKDRVIRRDKRTKFPVERESCYIETDRLIENLEKIRIEELDLERTGYETWFDKIKKERGIDLMARL